MGHLAEGNDEFLKRVRRIAGRVAAIGRALVAGTDCTMTLHLVAATRGAINGLMDEIIEEHVRAHVAHPDLPAGERAAGAEELIAVIRRYAK
jgi:DNA-binding FrmR family transcriptional regulator